MRHVPVVPTMQLVRDDENGAGAPPSSRPSTLRRAIRKLPVLRGRHYQLDYRPTGADWFRWMSNGLLALLIPLLAWQVVGAPRPVAWAILGVLCGAVVLGFVGETLRQAKR